MVIVSLTLQQWFSSVAVVSGSSLLENLHYLRTIISALKPFKT